MTTSINDRPVRSLGTGELKALPEVVLLPGLGAPGYLAPWARETAAWTRATVLDLPGWRLGGSRSCVATLDGIAEATARWLQTTRSQPVVLVGHSTGAQAVLRAALLVPDQIIGVVLAGPTFDPAARTVSVLLRRAASTLPREVAGEIPATAPAYLRSGVMPLLRFLLSALPDRPENVIAKLQVPSLVITGEYDGFAPPSWAQRLANLASAPLVILPGAHNACFPHAAEAAAALRNTVEEWVNAER